MKQHIAKRLLASLCAGAVVACVCPFVTAAAEAPEGYRQVAQNGKNTLYADMATGSFILENRESGRQWKSSPDNVKENELTKGVKRTEMQSQIIVDFVDMKTAAVNAIPSSVNSFASSVNMGEATVTALDNGLRVVFKFVDEGIEIPVEYTLEDDCFKAAVKLTQMQQTGTNRVTGVHLLPAFTTAEMGKEEGYLFVPDGSGALINLDNGAHNYVQYEEPVYGEDKAVEQDEKTSGKQLLTMPVFGIKCGGEALTGVISSGEENASICANVSGKNIGYNRVYAKASTATIDSTTMFETDFFNMREIYGVEDRKNQADMEVRYYTSSGEKAGYVGMAEIYRDYLLKNNLLAAKPKSPALHVDLMGAATRQASFLGIPYQKTFALTTFSQAQDIINDLTAQGAKVNLRYKGWTNGGLQNKKVTAKAAPLSLLGGKKDFQSLQKTMLDAGGEVYWDADFLNIAKSGNSFSALNDTVQTLFKKRTQQFEYLLSVFVPTLNRDPWYLLKTSKAAQAADKFRASFAKLGGTGVSFQGFGDSLSSDYKPKDPMTRGESKAVLAQTMEKYADENISIAVDKGNMYTYTYADRIYQLAMTSSGHLTFDESVPFAQIVLHGLMPYTSENINRMPDSRTALLKCLETGSDPLYEGIALDASELIETGFNTLYSETYGQWKDQALEYFRIYSEVYRDLYNQKISNHEKLSDDCYRTTYENGTAVIVNYGAQDVTVGETVVGAGNYAVVGR